MNTIIYVGEHPITFDVKWHTHEAWEVIYCTSGAGAFRFRDGQVMTYHTGEVVVIPPNVVHANSSEEGFTNIHLNISDPTFPYRDAFKIMDENGLLQQAVMAARAGYISDKLKKDLVLAALGDLIVGYIVMFRTNTEYTKPVGEIRQEILNNYQKPDFALNEYIRSMPFHYDYLRKVFKKELGMSPLEYLTSLRMKNAERLLSIGLSDGHAIAEIARMCGYENALYFSRVFKKHYGCSPSQYVDRQRQIHMVDPGRTELDDQ